MKFVVPVGPVNPNCRGIVHHLIVESLEILQENQQITLPMPEEIS